MTLRLILGLGNPGPEYLDTRHNIGFSVVEELAFRRGWKWDREASRTLLASGGEESSVLLGKPQTFMNRSGLAMRGLVEHLDLNLADTLVVFDDLHLPLGRLRLRPRGGAGGHRGLESVLETLRTDEIARLRLGIGLEEATPPVGEDLVEFVLGAFEAKHEEAVAEMVARAADACESWLEVGTETTMNRFNG